MKVADLRADLWAVGVVGDGRYLGHDEEGGMRFVEDIAEAVVFPSEERARRAEGGEG